MTNEEKNSLPAFFVYMYTFDDGMVYVGRSSRGVNRYGCAWCYKDNEKLYEAMSKKFEKRIVFSSEDPYAVGLLEHILIIMYSDKSYNRNLEYTWARSIEKSYGIKEPHNMTDYLIFAEDFTEVFHNIGIEMNVAEMSKLIMDTLIEDDIELHNLDMWIRERMKRKYECLNAEDW